MVSKSQKLIVIWALVLFVVLVMLMLGTLLALTSVSDKLHFKPTADTETANLLRETANELDLTTTQVRYDVSELSKQIYWKRYFDRIYYLQDRMDVLYRQYKVKYPSLEYMYLVNKQGRVMSFEPWSSSIKADLDDRNEIYNFTRYFNYIHRGSKAHQRGMLYHYLMDDDYNADGVPDDGLVPDMVRRAQQGGAGYIWRADLAQEAPFLWPYKIDDLADRDRTRFTSRRRAIVSHETQPPHAYFAANANPFELTEPPNVADGIVTMPYLQAASYMWDRGGNSFGFIGLVLNWSFIQDAINKTADDKLNVFIVHKAGVLVSTPTGDTTHSGEYIGASKEFKAIAEAAATLTNGNVAYVKLGREQYYIAPVSFANWWLVAMPKEPQLKGIQAIARNLAFWLIGLLILEALLFVVLVLMFNRFAVRPWREFADRLRAQDKHPAAIEMSGIFEYDSVAELTNQYLNDLAKYRVFGRPMTQKMMEEYQKNPDAFKLEGGEKTATVLYFKIQNFIALEQAISAKNLVGIVNRFYQHIEPIISLNNGYIEKLTGESLTIVFGAPIDDAEHANHALNAMKSIFAEVDAFNAKTLDELNNIPLMIGIGIATGAVFCGQMKTPEGNYYSLVGQTMLLAQQFESIAKNKIAVISDETITHATTTVAIDKIVTIKVRDINEPIKVCVHRA